MSFFVCVCVCCLCFKKAIVKDVPRAFSCVCLKKKDPNKSEKEKNPRLGLRWTRKVETAGPNQETKKPTAR